MQYLKQSTAVTLKIGPFLDDTDGKTAETGLTIAQADVRLSKNGANIAQKTEATSCTHDELGIYGCPADATDTNTLGRLQLWVHESGALPVWHEYMVLPANVYDSMFSTDKLEVDVTQLLGTAWLTPGVAGTPDVNTKLLGGTSQTGNDVGADVDAILTDTGTTLDTLIKDIPTVAEFEARSILSADYVVVGDTIAGVTAVTNDVGITQAGADKVRASVCVTGDSANSIGKILYEIYTNRLTSARAGYLDNINNANLATIADISTLTATEIAYLNASISSRSSHAASAIWSVGTRALTDKAGFALSTAGILAIWHQLTANIVTANTIGKLLKDDINATISSRSSHDAAAVWSAGSRALSTPNDYKANVSSLALEATLTAMKGATFAEATDSLEAIRDRGDAAWTTGAGGSDRLLMVDTTIATLASQTSFTLTAGSADDDAYNNCTIVIEDASTAAQKAVGLVLNYTGASKTVTLKYDPAIFTIATTDKIYILAENALKSTLANRQINIAADGDIAGNVDGSVGSIIADVGITQAGADKVWGTATRALTDKAGFSLAAAGITAIWDKNISAYTGVKAGTYLKTVYDDWLNAGRLDLILDTIAADVVNLDGHAMRGTDSAALASVCTEGRLGELDAANIPSDVDAIKAKTDNLPSGIQKNVALSNFSFLMTDTSDDPKTGLTVTVQISKDGGAFATVSNSVVEITSGYYKIDLTQSEMNADVIGFKATATGANQTSLVVVTS